MIGVFGWQAQTQWTADSVDGAGGRCRNTPHIMLYTPANQLLQSDWREALGFFVIEPHFQAVL